LKSRHERRFWFKLARSLGMSVYEAQHRISSREFAEWLAYDRFDPIGGLRDDARAGIIAATIANCNRGKGQRAFTAADFMPEYEGNAMTRKQTPDEIQARFRLFAEAHNARLKGGA